MERFPGAPAGDRGAVQVEISRIVAQGVERRAVGVFVAGFTFVLDGEVVVTVFRGRRSSIERQTAFCRRRMIGERQ